MTKEEIRLAESDTRKKHWKRWGPYLSERARGTVREDYSPYGNAWEYLPHDHARSRAYRWNEDRLAGISDRRQMICFAIALWNERDPILKERIFGLAGNEGNHGEDVKEYYFYLDSTPSHSYMKYLYKYPQAEFPYAKLVEENRCGDKRQPGARMLRIGKCHSLSRLPSRLHEKLGLHAVQSATAKAAIDFAALTARLKPRPFKTRSKSEFFRSLLACTWRTTPSSCGKPAIGIATLNDPALRSPLPSK